MKASLLIPTADEYAQWCLRWMGNHEHAVCSPYWAHSIQWLGTRLIPDALLNLLIFRVMLSRQAKAMKMENDRIKTQEDQQTPRSVANVS